MAMYVSVFRADSGAATSGIDIASHAMKMYAFLTPPKKKEPGYRDKLQMKFDEKALFGIDAVEWKVIGNFGFNLISRSTKD